MSQQGRRGLAIAPVTAGPYLCPMAGCLTFFVRVRTLAIVLLAIIGLQAAVPIRAALDRVPGPAFSATTLDVSLASTWRGEAKARPTVPMPQPVALAQAPRVAAGDLGHALEKDFAGSPPKARGPPPRVHPSRPPDSTAPPLA